MLTRTVVVGNAAALGIQLKHKIRNRTQHGCLAVTVRLQLGLGDARLLLGIAPEQQHVDRIGDRLHQAQRIRRKAARAQRAVKADTARELAVPAHGGRHHRFDALLLQNTACWQLFGQRVDILDGNRTRFLQLIMPRVQQPKGQILADVQRHRNTRRGPFMRGADLAGRLQPANIAAPHPNQLADPRQRKVDMRINIWPLMPQEIVGQLEDLPIKRGDPRFRRTIGLLQITGIGEIKPVPDGLRKGLEKAVRFRREGMRPL